MIHAIGMAFCIAVIGMVLVGAFIAFHGGID
jgi:hypothetical protein